MHTTNTLKQPGTCIQYKCLIVFTIEIRVGLGPLAVNLDCSWLTCTVTDDRQFGK